MSETTMDDYKIEVVDDHYEDEARENDTPYYGGEGWEDYVMSLFNEDEVIMDSSNNKLILCRGLRRVASLILGDVLVSKPTTFVVTGDDNGGPGKATVGYEITFNWMGTGELRSFGDVAETWVGNTDPLFAGHPAATACTKAEGRAYRKALMINCLTFEEMPQKVDVAKSVQSAIKSQPTDGEIRDHDGITDKQIKFLESKCKQLSVDPNRFVNYFTKGRRQNPATASKKEGIEMIQLLNDYQQNNQEVPEEVKS